MCGQARGLGDHSDVGIGELIATLTGHAPDYGKERSAVGVFVLGIAVREVVADVTQTKRAKDGITQGMNDDVAVGMGFDAARVRDEGAA